MRILHCADFHVRDKDIDECRKVLGHLVEYATKTTGLNLIVIAGDLTDRNDIKLDSATARLVIETVSRLSEVAPVAVLTGTKSHDGNIPEMLSLAKSYCPIYVSTYPEQLYLTDLGEFLTDAQAANNFDGEVAALLSFVPTPTKQFLQSQGSIEETDAEIGQAMTALFANFGAAADPFTPHILIGHWQVGGSYISETQQLTGRDIEISVDQILSAKPTVTVLGHIHMAQQVSSHPIFYSGSIYAKTFGEMDPKGFYIHDIDGNLNVTSTFIQGPARRLFRFDWDFTKDNGIYEHDVELDLVLHTPDPNEYRGATMRVEFKVWQDERARYDKDEIEKFFLSAGAASVDVRIIPIPRQNARAKQVLEVSRLPDKIRARAAITDEVVDEGILTKCEMLESHTREEILTAIKGAI